MDLKNVSKKSQNMSLKDKEILINLVKKYRDKVENKKTDAVVNAEKKQFWEKITNEFNSTTVVKRTSLQLRNTYKNMKRILKNDLAMDRANIFATGGGKCVRKVQEDNPLLPLIQDSVTPIPNPFDSSADYYNENVVK